MEDKVRAHENFAEFKGIRNTIKLLQVIKQYIYSNGSVELHYSLASHVHNQPVSNETKRREIYAEIMELV